MKLGDRVKKRRVKLGISQQDLAESIGVSQNAIHKLEDGTTDSPRKIFELAQQLTCSAEWLLNGDGEIESNPVSQLAINLKDRMNEKGLNQNELAIKSGMSQVNIHRLLTGKVLQTVKIFELADALNCDARWLSGNISTVMPVSIGDKIKARRKALQLTQIEVANFIGTSKASISLWETNQTEANGENLTKLAEILQCSPQALLNKNNTPYQTNTSSYYLAQYQRLLEDELLQTMGVKDNQSKQLLRYFSLCSEKDKALVLQVAKHHSS